ncbi:hypothetical protein ACFYOT_04000 [Saccharothrix saharensis]|uniref:RapZ C-terminal domain-containing protein n=1 Tax=Saccharothrix saharensis TaxID=571190 RepID=UPI0036CD5CC2
MSLRLRFPNTSDRRPTPAKKTPPVLVSSTQEIRQENTSMSDRTTNHQPGTVRVVSFGYLHSTPPTAELTLDVRRYLRDPARVRDAGLLDSNGLDTRVRDMVKTTPGADTALLASRLFALALVHHGKPVTIAIGCAGGRHRSVALAELLAADLRSCGIPAQVRHLHIDLPRVLSDSDDTREVGR